MNYAVIDLGSNSMRLSVYEHVENQINKIYNRKEIAGLAGYIKKDVLDMNGIQKACTVINDFKETAYKFVEAPNLHLFATASIRNIKNRDEAVKVIIGETALTPDVLDGNDEAALGFIGVSRFINCENGIMIDIGGASTELVLFKNNKAENLVSLPIGCLNLSVDYVSKIIPPKSELKKIKAVVKEQFSEIDWDKGVDCPLMVGTGGTLRALLKLSGVIFNLPPEQNNICASHVKEIGKLLKYNRDDIFRAVYKTIPERLMTISTGLSILQQAIKKFGCETISVSRLGVREGYLLDRVLMNNNKCIIDEGNRDD